MTLTHVNGVEIVERQKAIGATGTVGEGAQIQSVDELLLADGTTMFHCVHKNAVDCEYVNPVMGGVMSHQRSHSDRMVAKRALADAAAKQAELDEINAKKAAEFERRSAGMRNAHANRKARQLQTPSEAGGAGTGKHVSKIAAPSKSVIGDADLAKKAQQVIIAYNALQDAHDQFQNVFLGYMRAAQVASEKPTIDPQIVAKAAQYDIIQGALKGIK